MVYSPNNTAFAEKVQEDPPPPITIFLTYWVCESGSICIYFCCLGNEIQR